MVIRWMTAVAMVSLFSLFRLAAESRTSVQGKHSVAEDLELDTNSDGMAMTSNCALEVAAAAPWGDGANHIPLALESYPLFGEMEPEHMRKVPAPVRIRLGPKGTIHALTDASFRQGGCVFIHHLDAKSRLFARTPVFPANYHDTDESEILDFAVDAVGQAYLIEHVQPRQSNLPYNRLRKIGPAGDILWSHTGPISDEEFDFGSLKGSFTKLLMDGRSQLFLPATRHAGAIAKIDTATGAVEHIYTSDKFSSQVFINERGIVGFILYFPDLNRRGIGYLATDDEKFSSFVGGTELYGLLLYPFGMDASSNLYVWNDGVISRISPKAEIDQIAAFDNIAVRPSDGAIFTSRSESGEGGLATVFVESHCAGVRSTRGELRVPAELCLRHPTGWKLIHVDDRERYIVFGGEEPGHAGTILIYSSSGNLVETASPPVDLLSTESRLQSYAFWEVDAQGRIYLPILDPQGFRVVRLSVKKKP